MNARRWAWVAGAYLVGTVQAPRVLARLRGDRDALAGASAEASERDAHVLLAEAGRPVDSVIAMAADVAKAGLVALAAERAGLEPAWRAAACVAVVAGHAFPFHSRDVAGRGLAAASGVTMIVLPGPMVAAGTSILAGKALGHTGLGSTVGFAAVPVVAAALRRPRADVAMGLGVLGVILARRLRGVRPVAERDGWATAVARRLLFDADRVGPATALTR